MFRWDSRSLNPKDIIKFYADDDEERMAAAGVISLFVSPANQAVIELQGQDAHRNSKNPQGGMDNE